MWGGDQTRLLTNFTVDMPTFPAVQDVSVERSLSWKNSVHPGKAASLDAVQM